MFDDFHLSLYTLAYFHTILYVIAMNSIPVRTVEPTIPTLGKADWIGAALGCLVSDGVEAIQITRLAKALSVTRGSFYWHLSDLR